MFHKVSVFLNILVSSRSSDIEDGKFLQNVTDKLLSLLILILWRILAFSFISLCCVETIFI